MPVGDYASYRDAAGLDTIPVSPGVVLNWDTTVFEETDSFGIDVGNQEITVLESGHYLIGYNVPTKDDDDVGGGRTSVLCTIEINGVAAKDGQSYSYIRRAFNQFSAWQQGYTIQELTANDTIRIRAMRVDNIVDAVIRRPSESSLFLLRLDDSWNYLRKSQVTAVVPAVLDDWRKQDFEVTDEMDAAGYEDGPSPEDEFVLKEAGHYLLCVNMTYLNTNASNIRRNIEMRVRLDTVEQDGSRTSGYARRVSVCNWGSCNYIGIIQTTSANQILDIQRQTDGPIGDAISVANKTAFSMVKLPDTADFLRLTETGSPDSETGQVVTFSVDQPVEWDIQREVDAESFSHSTVTDPELITLNKNSLWLLTAALYAYKWDQAATLQHYPTWFWKSSGLPVDIRAGSFGSLNRGAQAANGCFVNGAAGSLLWLLDDASTMQIRMTEQNGTLNNNFRLQHLALQGLNLNTLFDYEKPGDGSETILRPNHDVYEVSMWAPSDKPRWSEIDDDVDNPDTSKSISTPVDVASCEFYMTNTPADFGSSRGLLVQLIAKAVAFPAPTGFAFNLDISYLIGDTVIATERTNAILDDNTWRKYNIRFLPGVHPKADLDQMRIRVSFVEVLGPDFILSVAALQVRTEGKILVNKFKREDSQLIRQFN